MIGIIGINYKTAPLVLREKLNFLPEEASVFLSFLKTECQVKEGVLLSTCNRLEIYFFTDKECLSGCLHKIVSALTLFKYINEEINSFFYSCQDKKAVEHLLSVAAGLDSMVLGENQILGQVKDAYKLAVDGHFTGTVLNKLFHKAFVAGKRVRTETGINRGASSVGYAAVELVCRLYNEISACDVLLMGMGQTGKLVLQSLFKRGCTRIHITNRTYEKTQALAAEFRAEAVSFGEREHYLQVCDIIITATSAKTQLITQAMVRKAMASRTKPLCLIDLSVPRDVEEQVREIPGVSLYNIDDLQYVVEQNHSSRKKEISSARKIVREIAGEYIQWLQNQHLSPVIHSLKARISHLTNTELDQLKKEVSSAEYVRLQRIIQMLNKKYLGLIVKNLKQIAHSEKEPAYIDMLNNLFELKDIM